MKKTKCVLINPLYDTPKTSLLTFHFEPLSPSSSKFQCETDHLSIDGKDVYLFDSFFNKSEVKELQEFSETASFSRKSYGSLEAIQKGEKPALSMDNKERWLFFSKPPKPIEKIYQFLGFLSQRLNVKITTLPWELSDLKTGSPSVIANFLSYASEESRELGKHQDSSPQEGVPFGIPNLYSGGIHESQFINGTAGKPWLITLLLYVTAENFKSEHGMGTVFYEKNRPVFTAGCKSGRFVLFESDLYHSIEESRVPTELDTWRVSYVYKLLMNPLSKNQSIKKDFSASGIGTKIIDKKGCCT